MQLLKLNNRNFYYTARKIKKGLLIKQPLMKISYSELKGLNAIPHIHFSEPAGKVAG